MPDTAQSSNRPWNVIAEEVCREQDPARVTKLLEELGQALEEQGIGRLDTPRILPAEKWE